MSYGRALEERYKAIKKVIKQINPKTALDIGANSGYFSLRLAKEFNIKCTAIENKKGLLPKTDIIETKEMLFDLEEAKRTQNYDLVLALSIFHHLKDAGLILKELLHHTRNIIIEIPSLEEAKLTDEVNKNSVRYARVSELLQIINTTLFEVIGESQPVRGERKRELIWIRN